VPWYEILFATIIILLLGYSAIALYSIYIQVEFASKRLSQTVEHLDAIKDHLQEVTRKGGRT
jgi:hypothetical protein